MAPKAAARESVTPEETSAFFDGMRESDVIIPQPTAIAVVTPASKEVAMLQQNLGGFTGSEGLSMADMVVPRYKIVQFMSRKGSPGNFYKAMTVYADSRVWQDVYHAEWKGKAVYIKFQQQDEYFIVSFKER